MLSAMIRSVLAYIHPSFSSEKNLMSPLQEAILATHRMLECRSSEWTVVDEEWGKDPSLKLLLPSLEMRPESVMMLVSAQSMLVVVTDALRIGMPQLKSAMEALETKGVHRLHIVSANHLMTQLQNIQAFRDRFRVISWQLILTYPLDHQLVPKHRFATPEDLKMLPQGALKRRSILPAIRADDAIIQYLGLSVNDIVRIDRLDGTVYFRVVIPTR
jgi:DNA-directed RNA polymerase subunit H (RpoH/RPB5)